MRSTTLGTSGPQVGVIGLGAMGMSFAYDMATPSDEDTNISVSGRCVATRPEARAAAKPRLLWLL
jgi:prephenate dehydrogenase